MLLETDQTAIAPADSSQCQLIVERSHGDYIVEDRNPHSYVCQLNAKLFTRSKLVINDRISIGEGFHFHFDGSALTRVPDRQGGRIQADNLCMIYKPGLWSWNKAPTVALRNACLTVEPNEFVGVLGPSGCGKSTLLKLLSGSLVPTRGRATINGVDIHRHPEFVRSLVGLVPQDDIVHPELTVWDAVYTSACLRLPDRIAKEAKRLQVETVLTRLRLWDFSQRRIRDLSGGQRKRVSIAIEILKKSSVLFLDEPSSGLDPNKEEELMIQLREIAEQGRTVVCTTHVLDRDFLFNKVCIVARGDVVYFGPTEEAPAFFGERNLLDVYRLLDDPKYLPVAWGHWGTPSAEWSEMPPPPKDPSEDETKALLDQIETSPPETMPNLWHFARGSLAIFPPDFIADDVSDLLRLARQGSGSLVVDFSRINPSNVPAPLDRVMNVHAVLSARGASLSLVRPPESLLEIFRVHRCLERVRVYDELREAVLSAQLGLPLLAGGAKATWSWKYRIQVLAALAVLFALIWVGLSVIREMNSP